MFLSLFKKECTQVFKSLIYWLFITCLALFFFTQMGKISFASKPVKGQEGGYGWKQSTEKSDIMEGTLGMLARDYDQDSFTTAPVGFTKHITLDASEKEKIARILETCTGLSISEIQDRYQEYVKENTVKLANGASMMAADNFKLPAKKGMSYKEFEKEMGKVSRILGPGSSYTKDRIKDNGMVEKTYEDALAEYENLMEKDGFTGGYARMFCDYMGIILGILPVFVTATRVLRDKRSGIRELIFVRKAYSFSIVCSRYLALCVTMFLPVLILSFYPLAECIGYAAGKDLALDYTAFFQYSFGWLLPSILIVTALSMLITEWTETAAAVLVQIVWWFFSSFSGQNAMRGGAYGFNLIPRHNTELNYTGFQADFSTLVWNRLFYTLLAVVLVVATVLIYEAKRKGRFGNGKISCNRKRNHTVSFDLAGTH